MDMSFGIKKGNSKEMILCEYRLRYKNINNISKSELDSKIKFSIDILGYEIAIHNIYLFIFSNKLKQQAYNKLRRLYFYKPNHVAIDLEELKSTFF